MPRDGGESTHRQEQLRQPTYDGNSKTAKETEMAVPS